MSSFLHGLGLLETAGEADVTHPGHVGNTSHGHPQEAVPCRRPLFPRPGCRSSTQDDVLPENSANALASPENLLDAVKSPSLLDRSSPEPNCSICLGKLQNKSFTNGCLHMFCYTCLLQWSKIKAECPLCKQSFKSIIHTVRSMQDYEEYELPTCPPIRVRELDPPANFAHYRRGYPDNVSFMHTVHDLPGDAFGIQIPFRYRTTMTSRRQSFTEYISHSWVLPPAPPSNQWRRRRYVATAEFRESIYVQDLWVQPPNGAGERYRDCTPAFYRGNPAQVHRLVPWLNRELSVLFHTANGTYPASLILDLILRYITRYEIRSPEFARLIRPHIGFRTEHFLHEFYSFASSHYDLIGYDQAVTYRPNPNPPVSIHVSDNSDSDVEIISETGEIDSEPTGHFAMVIDDTNVPFLRGSYSSGPESSVAGPSREPTAGPSTSRDESDDCEVVGYVKPLHERTPEVIELSSEDESLPEPQSVIDDLLRRPLNTQSSTDSDNLSSSSSSGHRSPDSDYIPQRKKAKKKVSTKRSKRRVPSGPSHSNKWQGVSGPVTGLPKSRRKRSSNTLSALPFWSQSNIPEESRLERSRHRAIASYRRRNLLSDSGSPTSSRSTAHPRMNVFGQPHASLNQSSSSVEILGSMTEPPYSSPSLCASPADDGETISTRAHHGSVASEPICPHGSEGWDHSDSASESDVALASLQALSGASWAQPSTSRASSSTKVTAVRPMKAENEPLTPASVIASVGNVGRSVSPSYTKIRKPCKRLRSAILPGPSTSAPDPSCGSDAEPSWQFKRRVSAIDSDSSESDSQETKPRIKSIVITRNFKPVARDQLPTRPDEASSKPKKLSRVQCKRKDSSSSKGKRNSSRLSSSDDSS